MNGCFGSVFLLGPTTAVQQSKETDELGITDKFDEPHCVLAGGRLALAAAPITRVS